MIDDHRESDHRESTPPPIDESPLLMLGDCMERMREIPDASVNLICSDPPYMSVKKNHAWDNQWKTPGEFLDWMGRLCGEWRRVLAPNGSLYVFASPRMAARVECKVGEWFEVLSSITWTKPNDPGFDGWKQKCSKESLRVWYPHSERIIFAALPDQVGPMIRDSRIKAGLSTKDLAAIAGAHGAVNHGGSVSNWERGLNTPTRPQWHAIAPVLGLPPYDQVVRIFAVTSDTEYIDVWNFESIRPYAGKHVCEKPLSLISHIITASSRPGDTVLDAFMGSGVTGEAALSLGRRFIGIEQDEKWFDRAGGRIAKACRGSIDMPTAAIRPEPSPASRPPTGRPSRSSRRLAARYAAPMFSFFE